MIIPTAEYDPLFADDGIPFKEKMIAYIQREFGDMHDPRIMALCSEDKRNTVDVRPTTETPTGRRVA